MELPGGGGESSGLRLEPPEDVGRLPTTCQFTRTNEVGGVESCARQFTEAFPARLEHSNGYVCETLVGASSVHAN
jgi:hypothetical protein